MAPETRVMYGWTGHRERDGKGDEGVKKRRDYSFRIMAAVRDDQFSPWIEMPLFSTGAAGLPADVVNGLFSDFLASLAEPGNATISKAILANLSKAINKEHAMDMEYSRLNLLDHEGVK